MVIKKLGVNSPTPHLQGWDLTPANFKPAYGTAPEIINVTSL